MSEEVAYLCDSKACGMDADCSECRHTTDISHAKNFKKLTEGKYMESEEDLVNHPSHYTQGNIETIDSMVLMFGTDYVSDYCLMNCFKYLERYEYKGNPEQDLQKALWYAEKSYMLKWNQDTWTTDVERLTTQRFTGCNEYFKDPKYMIEAAKNDIRTLAHMRSPSSEKCYVHELLIAHIAEAIDGMAEDSY